MFILLLSCRVRLSLTKYEERYDSRPDALLLLVDHGRQGRSQHEEGHHGQRQGQPLAAAKGVDGLYSRQAEDEIDRSYISDSRLEGKCSRRPGDLDKPKYTHRIRSYITLR